MRCATVMAGLFLATLSGLPCSIVYIATKTAPNFEVKVEDRGKPVQDLRVTIERKGNVSILAMTDRDGVANFRNVPAGSYQLALGTDAGMTDAGAVDVKPGGPKHVTVARQWPTHTPISVRSLRGVLRTPQIDSGSRIKMRLALDLRKARSGGRLQSVEASEKGEFSFDEVVPGIYFLTLKRMLSVGPPLAYSTETGEIAVEVDPDSSEERLDLDFGWTSCGLWYSDASQCRSADLQLDRLAGRVTDSGGGSVWGAEIVLFDANQKVVESLRSDQQGNFASLASLAGDYRLVVSRPGFTTLRATVHAQGGSAHSPFSVKLGVGGSCGGVDVR